MNTDMRRHVLGHVLQDRSWIPEKGSEEDEIVLEMAEMGWITADPSVPSGIGVTDRGMDLFHKWGGVPVAE